MADRVLNWYIETLADNAYSDGPVHILDQAYVPTRLKVHVKRAADAGNFSLDIRADGVSILPHDNAALGKGQLSELDFEDFAPLGPELPAHSLMTLHLTHPNGAAGISVSLELEITPDIDVS